MTALLAEAARHPAACADDVEVTWITPDALDQSMPLSDAWSVPFECGLPVRRFTARVAYADYIGGALETHLREYLFWLMEGRMRLSEQGLPPL
ncbi:MAG: hypothetical protein QOF87_3812 [Pseudonocardiales bacterium]|nr:hypothetical protein [Pseudonocardiales bacterium]